MEYPKRKQNRLKGYNYSSENYYFVTICTHNKDCIFAQKVGNGLDHSVTRLSTYGEIAQIELLNIPIHFSDARIDKYVIMPNHIHAIVVIGCNCELTERSRPFPTLSHIIGLYKSGVTNKIHKITPNLVVWQKSFNDHIIRNQNEYDEIVKYINQNELKLYLKLKGSL